MAFATTTDVATRLGRDLTAAETDAAELVIEVVTGLIAEAVNRDSDWATALDPVPATLRLLCIEKAVSAIVNPHNVASLSEQLGQFQHSETYPRASDVGLYLSDDEERRARFAVHGITSASVRIQSVADDTLDYLDDYEINESWES